MTNPYTGQPLTRRELRALAEQAVAPPTPAPAYGAIPPLAPEPQYVLSAEALRSVIAPSTPPPAPTAPPALSRREMREREQQASGLGPQYPPADAVPPSHFSPLAQLVQPSAPPFVPPAPSPPLPPVFGGNSPTDIPFTDAAPYFGLSRDVGDVPVATNSLILPHQPQIDMAGPLGSTGEIIVTGQILMPAQLSETGVSRSQRADRDYYEQFDSYSTGATAVMSRPVGAMQAVSSKGDDTDILLVRRNRWGTGAIVTALASSVLGLAAVALVVLTLMTDALA